MIRYDTIICVIDTIEKITDWITLFNKQCYPIRNFGFGDSAKVYVLINHTIIKMVVKNSFFSRTD